MKSVNVIDSFFYSLTKIGSGGAIEIVNDVNDLNIKSSFFASISSTEYAGAVYASIDDSQLYYTSFIGCFSTNHVNNMFGNAVYLKKGNSILYSNSFDHCGPTSNCADSSISCETISTVTYHNGTSNYGIEGSSGFSSRAITEGSSVKYMIVCNGHDSSAIECIVKLEILLSNFINNTSLSSIIWVDRDDIMTLNQCIFKQCCSTFSNLGRRYFILNCTSDKSFASITSTNIVETLPFTVFIPILDFKKKKLTCELNFNIKKFLSIILKSFIFIF